MKIRCLLLALLITQTAAVFAQSRSDVRIYISQVTAEDPAHSDFFRRNFTMEISAAGYTVTENIQDADYTLRLTVRRNVNINNDGTTEPAGPNEHQFMLQIILMRNSDSVQIVSLSFGFNELEEMYNHNLSLVYQTLANVPLGAGGDDKTLVKYMVGREVGREDWWRNKWLYFRMSADYPINYYSIKPDGLYKDALLYKGNINGPERYSRINPQIVAMPGVTAGMEFQFLDWMSLEANFELRLWDTVGFTYITGIGAQLKFPIKPFTHLMIEPYAAGVLAQNLAKHSINFPRYSVGGGIQIGSRGGNAGVIFFDINYMHSLDEVETSNPDDLFPEPNTLHWERFVIGLSIGFKVGFINRSARREEPSTWLFGN